MRLRWLEQSEDCLPAGEAWLSPEERQILGGLRFAKRRADWRLGRWTAKRAVAACLDGPRGFSEIEIRAAPSGAPEVFRRGVRLPAAISISHRAGRACCAVADAPVEVGCDLEVIEAHSRAFAEDYFTPSEQRLVSDAAPADRSLLTALVWSAKESALKALRVGLRADTRSVVVYLPAVFGERTTDGDLWRPLLVHHCHGEYHGWWRSSEHWMRTVVAAPYQPAPLETTLDLAVNARPAAIAVTGTRLAESYRTFPR